MDTKAKTKGFTLIEIMIVVAIAAILATIAYPAYLAQVNTSRRSEATSWLEIVAIQQEIYYNFNNRFATTLELSGGPLNIPTANGYYNITSAYIGASNQTYRLTATPAGWADAECGNFMLSNTNVRWVSGDFDGINGDGDNLPAADGGDGVAADINDIRDCWN